MRETAALSRYLIGIYQAIERVQDGADSLNRIGSRIYANHCISTSVEKPFEGRQQNSANVVGRMVGLNADAQHSALTHRVTAPRHIADFGTRQYQIFVAHDLGNGGCYLRDDGPLDSLQLCCTCCIVQNELSELTDGHAPDGQKSVLIECLEKQAADIVGGWID